MTTVKYQYKPDWEKVRERYRAFWNREIVDRCCVNVAAPIDISKAAPVRANLREMWTDFGFFHEANAFVLENTYWAGDSVPRWRPGRYPFTNTMAAMIGADVELHDRTAWVFPMLSDGEIIAHDYRKISLNPFSFWKLHEEKCLKTAVSESKGLCLPTLYLLASSGDTLAALRGTEELLIDLCEYPDYVRDFDMHLVKLSLDLFDDYYKIADGEHNGVCDWLGMWGDRKTYTIQNDFAYMISREMYNEIFLPSIEMKTKFFTNTLYHVDGVGAFKHVDALCALPNLNAMQIYPGVGKSVLPYMDLLKKVQAAGKGLWLYVENNEIETVMSELSSKGLFLSTPAATPQEADEIVEKVTKWTRE